MKSIFLAIFSFTAAITAQNTDNLPACGQTCAANMIGKAKSSELGCDTGDIQCLCTNQNFIYGIRDCSQAICDSKQAAQVIAYGVELCRGAGVAITSGEDGKIEATATDATGAVRTASTTIFSDGSAVATSASTVSGGAAGGGRKVSTYTTVFTNSNGDVVTTEGITTVAAKSDDNVSTFTSDGTEIIRTSVESTEGVSGDENNLTTFTTDGTEVVSTMVTKTVDTTTESSGASETVTDGAATGTEGASGVGSETGTTTDASGNTSSDNVAMPKMTAAPAGILAAAGVAMLLL